MSFFENTGEPECEIRRCELLGEGCRKRFEGNEIGLTEGVFGFEVRRDVKGGY